MGERKRIETALDDEWVSDLEQVSVSSLRDGDSIRAWETVLLIEGPLSEFIHLETLYLGVLARRTRISTNVAQVARAANTKPVFFFPAVSTTGLYREVMAMRPRLEGRLRLYRCPRRVVGQRRVPAPYRIL
ncbi:MAG: hypothetical protein CM1200mP18_04120 [Gammaproteobacteria bacterium]|nr:MAG: hypothetical protein CM1200mP18_04120 [Gammaproteobacteria bacterium]